VGVSVDGVPMSSGPAFFDKVYRIEVHGYPPVDEDERNPFFWRVTARISRNDNIILWGYLRQSGEDGFGQVQVLGFPRHFLWSEVTASEKATAKFLKWCRKHATEVLYDTARRALQTQAAAMDFQFELDVTAPDVEPVLVQPSAELLSQLSEQNAESAE